MEAIRLHKKLDSETLYLPELKPLIGKRVEIIVLEEPVSSTDFRQNIEALRELAEKNLLADDIEETVMQLREISKT